ncbi:hypothetical protein, partial [Oleiphilus sp. HI0043]
ESEDSPASDEDILGFVEQTNSSTYYLNLGFNFQSEGIIRYDTNSKIPLYFVSNGGVEPDQKIISAINEIEDRLGDIFEDIVLIDYDLSVFKDHTSDGNEPIYSNRLGDDDGFQSFLSENNMNYGIAISEGTSFRPSGADPSSYCGNYSRAPYAGGNRLRLDESYAISSEYLGWVNLGNGTCSWSGDYALHEIAHALGMFGHFDPHFGLWDATAMDVLATIYNNPAGTPYDQVVVLRAD